MWKSLVGGWGIILSSRSRDTAVVPTGRPVKLWATDLDQQWLWWLCVGCHVLEKNMSWTGLELSSVPGDLLSFMRINSLTTNKSSTTSNNHTMGVHHCYFHCANEDSEAQRVKEHSQSHTARE